MTDQTPLSETAVDRKIDEALRDALRAPRPSRKTVFQHADVVTSAPSRTPWVYWPLSLALIGGGFRFLAGTPMWVCIGLGVALLPGATDRVKALLGAVVPFVATLRNGKAGSPPDTNGLGGA